MIFCVSLDPYYHTFFQSLTTLDELLFRTTIRNAAPTNDAFDALPDGLVNELLLPENILELTDILTYHVINGGLPIPALLSIGTINTLNGAPLNVTTSDAGDVLVNGVAKVILSDVEASNGIIHVIDMVLLPPISDDDDGDDGMTEVPTPTPGNITSNVPTILPPDDGNNGTTQSPTSTGLAITPPPASDLGMKLYGIVQQLSTIDVELYQVRTASYIEDFYNNYDPTTAGGDDDDTMIRGEVIGVVASVQVTNQVVDDGSSSSAGVDVAPELDMEVDSELGLDGGFRKRNPSEYFLDEHNGIIDDNGTPKQKKEKLTQREKKLANRITPRHNGGVHDDAGVHHNVVTIPHRGPRHHSSDNNNKKKKMVRTRNLQVINCLGPGVDVVFAVTLEYQLRGDSSSIITQDDIINEPFSTSNYRLVYQNEYLLQPFDGTQPFEGLTCTSAVEFPTDDDGTTLSPISSSGSLAPTPSMSSSGTTASPNTIMNATAVPTSMSSVVDGTMPPVSGGGNTTVPTPSPIIGGTMSPVAVVGTTSSPDAGMGNNGTTNAPTNGTLLPSYSPTTPMDESMPTAVVTPGDPVSITPDPRSDLEMDLIGLLSLSEAEDQFQWSEKTGFYIRSFYNDASASILPPGDVRNFISDVTTAVVTIQDQIIPMGDITAPSCDEIDPLSMVYTLEMNYVSTNADLTFDDIITYPFSTEAFRADYIDNYLKVGDTTGGFAMLQCVSEVRIPSGDDGSGIVEGDDILDMTSTTSTTAPMVDDIFGTEKRMIDPDQAPNVHERKCDEDSLQSMPKGSVKEFEVSFVYGVESSSRDYSDYIDELETLILDYTATSVLRCPGGAVDASNVYQSVQVRKKRNSDGYDDDHDTATTSVVRIRYPEYGQITTMSKSGFYVSLLGSFFFLCIIRLTHVSSIPAFIFSIQLNANQQCLGGSVQC